MEECEDAREPSVMGSVAGDSLSPGTCISSCSIRLQPHKHVWPNNVHTVRIHVCIPLRLQILSGQIFVFFVAINFTCIKFWYLTLYIVHIIMYFMIDKYLILRFPFQLKKSQKNSTCKQ